MEKISGSGEQPQNTGENGKSIPKSAYEQVFFEQLRSGVEYDESKLSDEQLEAYKAAKKSYEKTKAINKERKQEHDKKLFKKITAGALVAMIGTGIGATVKAAKDSGVFNGIKLNSDDPMVEVFAEENPAGTAEAAKDNEVVDVKELTGNEKLDALIDGSFEQYDNVGLYKYEMDKKFTDNAVSNPKAILEYMGVNPEEATAEDYGQAYEYVVYSQKESAAFVAVANGFEGFDKLSYEQGEQKIANMTAEEKEDFQDQLKEHFDDTTYEFETGKGTGTNHFIKQHEDGSTYGVWITDDETGIEHVNIKHAEENGGYEITYAQVRCFNTGKKIIIVHSDGSIEETEIYTETPPEEVTPPDDTPTPTPTPTPKPTPTPTPTPNQPKNTEAEKKNAGPVVTPMELNENVTPKTTIEQDQANFEAIRRQQEEDQARAAEAARVASEQAERERTAAAEAEQRRQAEAAAAQARAAEEAANQARAEEQARAAQAAAAEAERQAAAEAAAREAAQREADSRAVEQAAEAASNQNDTASERSDAFANGDF